MILNFCFATELPASSGLWNSDPSTQQKFDLFNKAVLNLKTGVPSEGVSVILDKKEGDKWVKLNSAVTSQDGRINALYPVGKDIEPGDYRVIFETGKYYANHNEDTFFPEIPVIIHVKKSGEHYHIPLLLSQYGYSTYRGS